MSLTFTEAPATELREKEANPYASGIELGNKNRDKSYGHAITAKTPEELDKAIAKATNLLRRAAKDANVTARVAVKKDEKGTSADFRFIVKDREIRTRKTDAEPK